MCADKKKSARGKRDKTLQRNSGANLRPTTRRNRSRLRHERLIKICIRNLNTVSTRNDIIREPFAIITRKYAARFYSTEYTRYRFSRILFPPFIRLINTTLWNSSWKRGKEREKNFEKLSVFSDEPARDCGMIDGQFAFIRADVDFSEFIFPMYTRTIQLGIIQRKKNREG